MSMLRIKNIKKSIKEKTIVNDISFDVSLGTINGLLGPNGAGKTTTFYIIAGLMKCDQGKVIFNDVDISKLPMHKRSKLGIKYLPQEPSIFQNLSVYENLLGLAEISIPKKQDIDIFIEKSIDEFNLSKILDLKGRQLSGGQRRKVEIARTLAAKPEIILLDEPFAGIDPIAIDEIKQVLIKLKQKNIGILITDHNVREALEICDQAMVISNGAAIARGNKSSLINNELVKKVYLGNMYK
ncbi:LPS export ABC transporter ATP-binding protein [Gammaproteobacteria bacterium]|nr:LPS export ABC transporter ATP-binding protein [Gammaproteobacteria bacterium]MDB2489092.1 LPS export ABC transporter ATP-binding protein [Gammaproteobacteria bacterium]MDC3351238.1 LPS export ABC transporter ATP-binding protein [Gammaproteobacteria bacterium]MDC3375735.1 LPS export ABC transporter ATP-binding protein [Gammaproteobacteria bacterium]